VAIYLYALLSWSTRERQPAIGPANVLALRDVLPRVCHERGTGVLAMGFRPDQVQLVLQLGPRLDIPALAQQLKAAGAQAGQVEWSTGYDLRSIGVSGLPGVVEYVQGLERPSIHC